MNNIEVKPVQPAGECKSSAETKRPLIVEVKRDLTEAKEEACVPKYRDEDDSIVDFDAMRYARDLDGFADYLRDKEFEQGFGGA